MDWLIDIINLYAYFNIKFITTLNKLRPLFISFLFVYHIQIFVMHLEGSFFSSTKHVLFQKFPLPDTDKRLFFTRHRPIAILPIT